MFASDINSLSNLTDNTAKAPRCITLEEIQKAPKTKNGNENEWHKKEKKSQLKSQHSNRARAVTTIITTQEPRGRARQARFTHGPSI